MSRYPYHRLNGDSFEDLIVKICSQILGIGTKGFRRGPDGGKDGLFTGTAEKFPSTSSPWSGVFIIQAKHTDSLNASLSDSSFKTIYQKEIEKLKKTIIKTPFDCYLLFTNRKAPGSHTSIEQKFRDELNITNVQIIGIEDLDRYLDDYPDIVDQFRLIDEFSPPRFYNDDIRDIIRSITTINIKDLIPEQDVDLNVMDLTEKNKLNNITQEYNDAVIKGICLRHFHLFDKFLRDPRNVEYQEMYRDIVADLSSELSTNPINYSNFGDTMNRTKDRIITSKNELRSKRALVLAFINYMYVNCDIGKKVTS